MGLDSLIKEGKELLAQPERDLIREIQYLTDCLMDAEGKVSKLLAQPEQTEQEPVAWKDRTYGNLHHVDYGNSIPLYTAPPTRKPLEATQYWV